MSDGMQFGVAVGTWFAVIVLAIGIAEARDHFGQLPRGTRWAPKLWRGMKGGTGNTMLRLFYPEVWKERQKAKDAA